MAQRTLRIGIDKGNEQQTAGEPGPSFYDKTDYILSKVEKYGVKVFIGIVLYVAADTARKIAVEVAKNDSD